MQMLATYCVTVSLGLIRAFVIISDVWPETRTNRLLSLKRRMVASAALVPAPAPKMKPHHEMSRRECLEELKSAESLPELEGTDIQIEELTLEELRSLVRSHRAAMGVGNARQRLVRKSTSAQQVSKARLPELRKMCDDRRIRHGPSDLVADLRLRLRRWDSTSQAGSLPSESTSSASGNQEQTAAES